jgi:hypothetical protein
MSGAGHIVVIERLGGAAPSGARDGCGIDSADPGHLLRSGAFCGNRDHERSAGGDFGDGADQRR